ncbi:hypothetical protein Hdeb2414_s0056g00756791 [Helianthus debilis subsp. tardiflorus]
MFASNKIRDTWNDPTSCNPLINRALVELSKLAHSRNSQNNSQAEFFGASWFIRKLSQV